MQSSQNNSGAMQLEAFLRNNSINNDNLYKITDKVGNDASDYPVRALGGDPDDAIWATRKSLVNNNGVVPGIGLAIAGPEYDAYANRKRIELNNAEFKAWITKNVDLSTPEKQEYYYNMFPWLRDERLAEIQRQAALQTRMASININGLQSEDDWRFKWALDQGYIQVSDQALQNLNKVTDVSKSYQQGLFSVFSKKMFPTSEGIKSINYADPMSKGNQIPVENLPTIVKNYEGITAGIPKNV